jgi:hypothetical protein
MENIKFKRLITLATLLPLPHTFLQCYACVRAGAGETGIWSGAHISGTLKGE